MTTALTNWAGSLSYHANAVHFPTSVEQVQDLVARCPQIKALGTRHSFNRIADSPGGSLVSLTKLEPDISVDSAANTVSVTAGTPYGVLAAELHTRGYALPNMGSLPHISVAGATSTGTHGSGDHNGILSTAISALEIVIADGSLLRIDRSSRDLTAVAVGMGAFGVITRLILDIQPTYQVRQDVYREARWESVLGAFDEVMASAYSVSLIGDFARPTIYELWQKTRVEPQSDSSRQPPPIPRTIHGGTWYDDADPAASHTVRGGVPGPWSERLPHFRIDSPPSAGGDELQTEYFIERRHATAALDTLRSLGDRISPHLHAAEIRTVAGDDLWASPAYQRPSVCIGFTWRKHPVEVESLITLIEDALNDYEPRPHWGKLYGIGTDALQRRFPRLSDFQTMVRKYDPTGKFGNTAVDIAMPPRS